VAALAISVHRADTFFTVDDEQGYVGIGQFLLHPPLHAAGQLVAWPLDAWQVDQHYLVSGVDIRRYPADCPSGGLWAD
jgi:hypothetical protein